MSRIHTRRYVPDREDAYTSIIPWWHLPLLLSGLGAFGVPIALTTQTPTLVAAVVIGALAVTVTVVWLRRSDRDGVHMAIDARGVYYGTPPRAGLVTWTRITQVHLGLQGDDPWAADALRLRVRFTASDSGVADERVTVIGKDSTAVERAVSRYAPAHVHLGGILARQSPNGN